MLPIHNELDDSIVGRYSLHCIVVNTYFNSAGNDKRKKKDLLKKLLIIAIYYGKGKVH